MPSLSSSRPRSFLQAAFWMVLIALISVSNDVIAKFLGSNLHPFQISFLRFAASLAVLLPILFAKIATDGPRVLKTQMPALHFWRGFWGTAAVALCTCSVLKFQIACNTSIIPSHSHIRGGPGVCSLEKLTSIQFPSTITQFEGCRWQGSDTPTLCSTQITFIKFNKRLKFIGHCNFMLCTSLRNVDFSECSALETTGQCTFRSCPLTHLNFANCTSLTKIGALAFGNCPIEFILLPFSLRSIDFEALNTSSLKTVIWKGHPKRLPVVDSDYPSEGMSSRGFGGSLENLVASGQITEIFIA